MVVKRPYQRALKGSNRTYQGAQTFLGPRSLPGTSHYISTKLIIARMQPLQTRCLLLFRTPIAEAQQKYEQSE